MTLVKMGRVLLVYRMVNGLHGNDWILGLVVISFRSEAE